ncbi:hypothetical protein ON010_g18923 [Phytophthora cinnamomi]|nr:hypothetical protein ON010_g18923 [Phytophthora cinnamomi]
MNLRFLDEVAAFLDPESLQLVTTPRKAEGENEYAPLVASGALTTKNCGQQEEERARGGDCRRSPQQIPHQGQERARRAQASGEGGVIESAAAVRLAPGRTWRCKELLAGPCERATRAKTTV